MKKIIILSLWLITLCSYLPSSFSKTNPRSLIIDRCIKTVPYIKNNIIPIYGTTFITTQIIFSKQEKILDIQNGDADAWTINISKNIPNVLNIKPTILGSNTNMIVTTLDTNQKTRNYFFHTISNKNTMNTLSPTYAIEFTYPQHIPLVTQLDEKLLTPLELTHAPIHSDQYNWDYSFYGATSIMPSQIFDDGKFTYMHLQDNQPIPAIFAINTIAGQENLVNYRRARDYIIVQQISPQFTLRNGKHVVTSIFNNKLINSYQESKG